MSLAFQHRHAQDKGSPLGSYNYAMYIQTWGACGGEDSVAPPRITIPTDPRNPRRILWGEGEQEVPNLPHMGS